jgi:hypothetical protein
MKRFLSTSAVALVLAIPTVVVLGPAGVAPAAAAGVEASGLPACTDTWTATSGGNWNTSSDWSTGLVPGSGSVACIGGSGTFTVTDDTSPTVGSFQLGGGSGVQTLVVSADGGNTSLSLNSASTVLSNGIFTLAPTGNGNAFLNGSGSLTIASGGTLQTYGASGSNVSYLRVPITNQAGGTLAIGPGGPAGTADQDSGTLTTNAGTVQVASGGTLALADGSRLTNTGVLGVTVGGTAGGMTGPGIALGGTLQVTTVGTPSVGTVFTPITGSTGTFAALAFGPAAYGVSYPSGTSVQLVTGTPFTVAPVAISPEDGLATGPVVVASIARADLAPSGGYSATVNWGDGSPTQAASVTVTGSSGSVTAPTHTYSAFGTDTVTVVVSNTDGTSATTTQSVTIGPDVTAFSKTTIKAGHKLTTKISGYGLNATAVVTVSNPGVTVVSVKVSKATKKKPYPVITLKLSASKTAAVGGFSVTITESGGTTSVPNAITVAA